MQFKTWWITLKYNLKIHFNTLSTWIWTSYFVFLVTRFSAKANVKPWYISYYVFLQKSYSYNIIISYFTFILYLNNFTYEWVLVYNKLGIYLTPRLNFNHPINFIIGKLLKIFVSNITLTFSHQYYVYELK